MATLHLHKIMTAQEYIQLKLAEVKQPLGLVKPENTDELVQAILKACLSKKFRKYSASDDLISHIEQAIRINVEKNEPINFTFLHGAYKLWRLEESPYVDWAELFALTYYSNWVKPICEIYEPGVWFDFFVDDLIVPKLDNVPLDDIHKYIYSYQELINFLKQYQPTNLKMTITTVGSRFDSLEAFDVSLKHSISDLTANTPGGLPTLTDAQKAMVELNTKATSDQLSDPLWREKVFHLHNAYAAIKGNPGYHKNRPEKILVFTQPLPSGTTISVGTTKDSIMKFWIGTGVLKPRDDSFRQIILSPAQLKEAAYDFENIDIDGLNTKSNFNKIRILK